MKFSIITVCKNSQNSIENTILSVINQTWQDFEYIIIDGVSTDKTLEIVGKYSDKIAIIRSEEDSGLYEAMNKGINLASGEYLFFLNSDDCFAHNNILMLVKNFIENQENSGQQGKQTFPDIFYGDLGIINKNTGEISIKKNNKLNKIYLLKNTPCQPASFYKKEAFDKFGLFDEDLKIVSDHEWFLRVLLKHKGKRNGRRKAEYLGFPISFFSIGGISTSKSREKKLISERKAMLGKYFSPIELLIYEFISKYLRSLTELPLLKNFFRI